MYAELHCRTNFSFLEGASHADELVARAAQLGYTALAVTDRNSLAGIVRAHIAAADVGLKLIVGAEITPLDAPPAVLWATDRASYGRLARLITVGRRRAPKGQCELTLADVAQHSQGLLAGVVVAGHGTKRGGPPTQDEGQALELQQLARYRDVFGGHDCYLLAQLHCGPDDARRLARLLQLSRQARVPLAAAGDVHYHVPGRMVLHEVLTAIRLGTTVDRVGQARFPNAERHLRARRKSRPCFRQRRRPCGARSKSRIGVGFRWTSCAYEYPEELAPRGNSPFQYLVQLTWRGAGAVTRPAFRTRCSACCSTSWP